MNLFKFSWLSFLILTLPGIYGGIINGQPVIKGSIDVDTSIWALKAYLAIIPDFTQVHTISYQTIIERSDIDSNGNFSFGSEFIPEEDQLYRIHFSKKDDPPASLIIGGREENHFFVIANKNSEIIVKSGKGENLINNLEFSGYKQNEGLLGINKIADYLDTLDYYGTNLNREFISQAVQEKLRKYADTCSHPLVSLYAIYQSDFESDIKVNPDFYKNYLKRWKKEDSEYFRVFESQLNMDGSGANILSLLLILGIIALPIGIFLFRQKINTKQNPINSLTVQERRIFSMLQQGMANKEIAIELGVGLSTVKSHVNNIYTKLNISSRKEVMDYK